MTPTTLTAPGGTLWPIATKDVLVSVYKPGAAGAEAPFRTLRRHGFVSRGTTVHRHRNGRLEGTVALFSSLSVDAAALARRGERHLAERFADRAGALEQEPGFVEFVTYLATLDPDEASNVMSGREHPGSRVEGLLRGLAGRAVAERDVLLDTARRDGFENVESALPSAGRVVEANPNAVTVDLVWFGPGDAAITVLPRTMAEAVHRTTAGDFIGVLRQPTSADRIDVQVFPALSLHGATRAADRETPLSQFAQTSGPVLLSDADFDRVRAANPEPRRILVPVEIEE